MQAIFLFFLFSSTCCAAFDSLASQIRAIETQSQYEGCKWGIQARNITSNKIIYENPGANLFSVPASNNKVPNTYAAWMSLGSDYVFSTPIGAIESDESGGYYVTICGANDPSLSSDQLEEAASTIASISTISSASSVKVRVNNDRSDDELFPDSWEWGDLMYYYGAPPCSVILDGNTVTVRVSAGSDIGSPVNVTVMSPGGGVECFGVVNEALTVSSGVAVSNTFQVRNGAFSLVISGSMSSTASPQDFTIACRDPLRRAATVLSNALTSAGLPNVVASDVDEAVVTGADECNGGGGMILTSMTSDTLDVLLNHTLLESDNTYAEAILRRQSDDGSISSGLDNVRATLETWAPPGLNIYSYQSIDGSGLSRHDLVTPAFLASIMAAADEDYIHLLPLAGKTGTLDDRFIGTAAEGVLYAKTGTMTHVSALSGRVGDISLSILSDSCPQPASVVRDGIDQIAVLFAEIASF